MSGRPPPTVFVDAIDVVYDATIPYDVRFFESLDRIVQIEPWLERDKVMIDVLKSIGIEKGKAFKPDANTRDLLKHLKHLGEGQFYLMTTKDKDGRDLDGGKTYRLHVPPKAPVRQYWSATLYDRATHALIRDVARPSRGSQSPGLQTNSDGSVDLFFGPAAPAGKEPNWVPTRAGGRFEVLFRLYGSDKTFFDKVWQLQDIEEAK